MILILSKSKRNTCANKSELLHGLLKKIRMPRLEVNGGH